MVASLAVVGKMVETFEEGGSLCQSALSHLLLLFHRRTKEA